MPNSTALHVFTVYCFGYITPAPASVLTGYKINMLRPRFSTVAPKLELLPCPNTKGPLPRSVHAAMLSETPETPHRNAESMFR